MNIVRGLIARHDLEFLIHVHRQHVRRVDAIFLIEYWHRCRDFAAGTAAQPSEM